MRYIGSTNGRAAEGQLCSRVALLSTIVQVHGHAPTDSEETDAVVTHTHTDQQ